MNPGPLYLLTAAKWFRTLVDVPNKFTNRGKGKPDMNVRAYATMLIAAGQMEKPPSEKDIKAVTLGQLGGLKGERHERTNSRRRNGPKL